MALTTAGPPPAGIYWCAAIYTSFSLTAASQLAVREIPRAKLHLYATPKIGMLPPQNFALRASASLGMLVGTEETTAFRLEATSALYMGQVISTSFKIAMTASLSFGGVAEAPRGGQINVAVGRAAIF